MDSKVWVLLGHSYFCCCCFCLRICALVNNAAGNAQLQPTKILVIDCCLSAGPLSSRPGMTKGNPLACPLLLPFFLLSLFWMEREKRRDPVVPSLASSAVEQAEQRPRDNTHSGQGKKQQQRQQQNIDNSIFTVRFYLICCLMFVNYLIS